MASLWLRGMRYATIKNPSFIEDLKPHFPFWVFQVIDSRDYSRLDCRRVFAIRVAEVCIMNYSAYGWLQFSTGI